MSDNPAVPDPTLEELLWRYGNVLYMHKHDRHQIKECAECNSVLSDFHAYVATVRRQAEEQVAHMTAYIEKSLRFLDVPCSPADLVDARKCLIHALQAPAPLPTDGGTT